MSVTGIASAIPVTEPPSIKVIAAWLNTITLNAGVNTNHAGFTTQGNDVHVVFRNSTDVGYIKSINEGSSFTDAVSIGTTNEVPLTQCIAADGNYVHVVYARNSRVVGVPPTLHYRRSQDRGATWDGEVTLDDGTGVGNNRFPRVCLIAENGLVHFFWTTIDGSTFVPSVLSYRRSTDNGTTFSTETTLGNSTGAGRPEAILIDSHIHLVWTDTRDGSSSNGGETYYVRSDDYGVSWGTEVALSATAAHDTARCTIAGEGTNIVVGWQDPVSGANDIVRRYSTNGGVSWSSEETIVSGTGSQEHASLDSKRGLTALCYTDQNITPDTTYVKYSYDYGVTWSAAQVVYTPANDSAAPLVAFTSRFVQVMDRQEVSGGLKLTRSPVFEASPTATLLDDFNRASLGSNWTTPGVTTFTGSIVTTTSTDVCRSSSGVYRQGGYWNAKKYRNVDIIADLSGWADTNANGFTMYGRLREIGASATDGYAISVERDVSGTNWTLLGFTNSSPTQLDTVVLRSVAAGDRVALSCRGDLIIGWHFPSGATEWTQVVAGVDLTWSDYGYVGFEFLNNQVTKVTNLWVSEVVEPALSTPGRVATSGGISW